MVQLKFLAGALAGSTHLIQQFPCSLGRNVSSDVRVEDQGVWDKHLEIDLDSSRGFILKSRVEARTSVNGQPAAESLLRNGDVIELGGAKIQFWLNPTRQKEFRFREFLTWIALITLSFAQVALVYWLAR